MTKKLLLISNSTNYGEEYLNYPQPYIKNFLKDSVKSVLFLPYAGVTVSWDAYAEKVSTVFKNLGYQLHSIHHTDKPIEAIMKAECIVVGGGNTFNLLNEVQKNGLVAPIRERINQGIPYIGWSAGSNLACPTLKTTNDMPIAEPESFNALNLVSFQINPHYTDAMPPNHGGETREQRILEFLQANQTTTVVGLKEGSILQLENNMLKLLGKNTMRVFRFAQEIKEYDTESNLNFLL